MEIRWFSSLRKALRFSLRAPLIELFKIIGLGSSLGVGDGRTGAAVLVEAVSSASSLPSSPFNLTSEPLRQMAMLFSIHLSAALGAQELQHPPSKLSAGPLQREC